MSSNNKEGREAQSRAEVAYYALHKKNLFDKVSNKEKWLPENMPKHKSLRRHSSSGEMSKKASSNLASKVVGLDMLGLGSDVGLSKRGIYLAEFDPVIPANNASDKRSKTSVYYRKGSDNENCGKCEHYKGGQSCREVDGTILENATCNIFSDNGKEDMTTQSKTARTVGSPGRSCGTCTSNIEGFCKTAGESISPSEFCDSFSRDNVKIARLLHLLNPSKLNGNTFFQKSAQAPVGPGVGPMTGPVAPPTGRGGTTVGSSLASLLDGEIEENKQLRQQLTVMQQQMAQAEVNGPGAPQLDPMTGQPIAPPPGPPPGAGPGMPPPPPQQIDPMTGQPLPPQPPPPSPAEIQLQTALQQSEQEIDRLGKENQTLRDENRALHHAVEPDDMSDSAKRMYDRAGTNIQGEQSLPNESVEPDSKLPSGTLQEMLDKAMF